MTGCPVLAGDTASSLWHLCQRRAAKKARCEWQSRCGNKVTPSRSTTSWVERSGRPTVGNSDQLSALVPILLPGFGERRVRHPRRGEARAQSPLRGL